MPLSWSPAVSILLTPSFSANRTHGYLLCDLSKLLPACFRISPQSSPVSLFESLLYLLLSASRHATTPVLIILFNSRPPSLHPVPPTRTHSLADPSILQHALSRLARIESRLGEINANGGPAAATTTPECDQCLDSHLKCDGNARNPCSWCLKRQHQDPAALNLSPIQQQQHGGPVCTYSNYEQAHQRQGLHRYVICLIYSLLFSKPHEACLLLRFFPFYAYTIDP